MANNRYESDVVVVGGGIAGIVTAYELINRGRKVLLIERDTKENFGGLAIWSFGGMFFVDTPEQRRAGMKDSVDLALRDWHAVAEFGPEDDIPKKWAEQYVNMCTPHVYRWLKEHKVKYFPVVHWVERGHFYPGNSYPRFHMVWGTGHGLATTMIGHLLNHPKSDTHLQILFGHKVEDIITSNGEVIGVRGTRERYQNESFEAYAGATVVAAGGMGGNIDRVKENWYKPWGQPPETILNGAHPFCDGTLHDAVDRIAGHLTHLDKNWPYAAGVHHPNPRHKDHGLSLVPCKSALWLDHTGKRFGPEPLVTAYDTRHLVETICRQDKKYSWQVLNIKIAYKEFAISGSEHNAAIRDKDLLQFLKTILRGSRDLVHDMIDNCEDFITADTVEDLVHKMNALQGTDDVKITNVLSAIDYYDDMVGRKKKFQNDEQIRRIQHARQYRGDRVRTCNNQKILDPKAMPLVAIREFILSRKTLGGIQTDLSGKVLSRPHMGSQHAIPGLYAVGESAGFGGGGVHGIGALEGTFLGGCVLTGRIAAADICGTKIG
jgi:predicted oxidoreductase